MSLYVKYTPVILGGGSGGGGGGSGTVTSVGLADGSTSPIYAISGSPVTTSGTLTFTLNTQTANYVFAGPTSGGAAQPSFRALVAGDLPSGTGTVTSVSVVSANGLAGTVANATTTPAITLSTTINAAVLAGNGTAISAATLGNLTDAGTDGITVTGGTGAVIGSGTSLSQRVADTTHNGYLSSTDWNTFNGKQSALSFIDSLVNTAGSVALSGDAASPGNSYFYGTNGSGTKGWYLQSGITPVFSGLTTDGVIYATSATAVASTSAGTPGNPLVSGNSGAPSFSATTTLATIVNTSNVLSIEDSSDATKVLAINVSGNTTGKTLTLTTAQSNSETLAIPNIAGSDTLATLGLAQTFALAQTFTTSPVFSSVNSSAALVTDGSKNLASVGYGSTISDSSIAQRDANGNLRATNMYVPMTITATTGGTTTLTAASNGIQLFTGTNTQTLKLPTTSLQKGDAYLIQNTSTGNVSVESSNGGALVTLTQNTQADCYPIVSTPTTAAQWEFVLNPLNNAAPTVGTVTSVQVAGVNGLSFSGGPVTTSGTITAALTVPTNQKFATTGSTVGYLFTVSSANATTGATYTNNSNTYTVISTIAAGTLLWCSGASAPQTSGTLTKASGTGDATITFSAEVAYATYTTPTSPAPLYLKVTTVAGGGGAGDSSANPGGGSGGGGGGGAAIKYISSPSATYPYIVGVGGAHTQAGSASYFGVGLAQANAGGSGISPGTSGSGGGGGSPGVGAVGDFLLTGNAGGTGGTSLTGVAFGYGGCGGMAASAYGGGGGAGVNNGSANVGGANGGGGGGVCGGANSGGSGGNGIVVVEEFYL